MTPTLVQSQPGSGDKSDKLQIEGLPQVLAAITIPAITKKDTPSLDSATKAIALLHEIKKQLPMVGTDYLKAIRKIDSAVTSTRHHFYDRTELSPIEMRTEYRTNIVLKRLGWQSEDSAGPDGWTSDIESRYRYREPLGGGRIQRVHDVSINGVRLVPLNNRGMQAIQRESTMVVEGEAQAINQFTQYSKALGTFLECEQFDPEKARELLRGEPNKILYLFDRLFPRSSGDIRQQLNLPVVLPTLTADEVMKDPAVIAAFNKAKNTFREGKVVSDKSLLGLQPLIIHAQLVGRTLADQGFTAPVVAASFLHSIERAQGYIGDINTLPEEVIDVYNQLRYSTRCADFCDKKTRERYVGSLGEMPREMIAIQLADNLVTMQTLVELADKGISLSSILNGELKNYSGFFHECLRVYQGRVPSKMLNIYQKMLGRLDSL
jgi:hypothetical protein